MRVVRTANNPSGLGHGYVIMAVARLLAQFPARGLLFFNRGISGNKVFQLAERWERDCLLLEPDVLSILVGVNDFWHTYTHGYLGSVDTYEQDYMALIDRTRDALPQVRFVICEPFLLPCADVTSDWIDRFVNYRKVARRVSVHANAVFVPFQSVLDRAAETTPPALLTPDGVHPTLGGCHLLAEAWIEAVLNAGVIS